MSVTTDSMTPRLYKYITSLFLHMPTTCSTLMLRQCHVYMQNVHAAEKKRVPGSIYILPKTYLFPSVAIEAHGTICLRSKIILCKSRRRVCQKCGEESVRSMEKSLSKVWRSKLYQLSPLEECGSCLQLCSSPLTFNLSTYKNVIYFASDFLILVIALIFSERAMRTFPRSCPS